MAEAKNLPADQTMSAADLLKAIDNASEIRIGVRVETDGSVTTMRWREKSEAFRKRVRRMIKETSKGNGAHLFHASISNFAGDTVVMIGDHPTS